MGRDGPGVRRASRRSIEITFQYRGQRCRERLPLEPTPANLRRAAQHRAAILEAIRGGYFDYATTFPDSRRRPQEAPQEPQDSPTLGSYLLGWLEGARARLKGSTVRAFAKDVRAVASDDLGTIGLGKLAVRDVKAWIARRGYHPKRAANLVSMLRTALAEAAEDDVIEVNPLAAWSMPRRREPREDDVDPFTAEEQAAILGALEGQGRNLVRFALWTGLRTSELVALDWGDVDWLRTRVRVSRAWTQGGEPESPKTRAGERDVTLLPPALEALEAQKAHTWLRGAEVFQNPRTGERWAGDQPIRKTLWAHALRRAGVRYRRPYQTRHTYASMMLSAGENPRWVADQMGHRDLAMLFRVYGRWIPGSDPRAGLRAVEMFGRNDSNPTSGMTARPRKPRPA